MAAQHEPGFSAPLFEALEPRLLLSTGPLLQSLSFTPGQLITTDLTSITATFDQALDPLTVNEETVQLRNAGEDGQFDTADDTFASPDSVSLTSGDTQIVMTFASASS